MIAPRQSGPAWSPVTWWRRMWRPVDVELLDIGAAGELLVGRVRLMLAIALTLVPLHQILLDPSDVENWVGFGTMLVAVALATALIILSRSTLYRSWLGFLTSAIDVSLVSAVLMIFLAMGLPLTATNSRVVFEFYFIAIFATCLRYDPRICLVAGTLAIAQFLAISLVAVERFPLESLTTAQLAYGQFSWGSQTSRLILLGVATALAWTIVQRTRRLRRLSTLDRLTDLFNLPHFLERMEDDLARSKRYGRPLTVALIDLDYFKNFNDAYGHGPGDDALRSFAAFMRRTVRRTDVLARYGGDQFIVMFPETGPDAARDKLEAMRAEMATLPLAVGRGREAAFLTISAGMASHPADADNVIALLERAEDRLFDAKHAGRNRIGGGEEGRTGEIVVAGAMQRISKEEKRRP